MTPKPWTWTVVAVADGQAVSAAEAAAGIWRAWEKWGPTTGALATGPAGADTWHTGPPGTWAAAIAALRRLAPDWAPPWRDIEAAAMGDLATGHPDEAVALLLDYARPR